MTLEQWAAVADIVAGIAVVVSLVYLASQVRISNRLGRAEAWRQPASDLNSLNATFASDPVFRAAFTKALHEQADRSTIDPEAASVLDFYLVSITNLYEQLFREVREGVLDDRAMRDFAAQNLFELPYYRSSWHRYRPAFGRSFVRYFEESFDLPPEQP